MTTRPWRDSVIAYIRVEATPGDKFGHMPRLYALASQIAEGENCDDDVLFAAAWMHDLGVFGMKDHTGQNYVFTSNVS